MRMEMLGHEFNTDGSCFIAVGFLPNWLDKLLGMVEEQRVYIGSSTVWHRWGSGARAPSSIESWLADRWTMLKHKDKNPHFPNQ